MVKYAFMSFSTPELTLEKMLTLAKELGYDAIEPRLEAGHAHGIEVEINGQRRDEIRRLVEGSGPQLACLATSCKYADPETRKEMVERTRLAVDLAGDLKVSLLRVFGGAFPEDMSRAEAIDSLVWALLQVADYAGERGVTLCLETHDAWCNPRHVVEVMERVSHPAVGVNWDVMHPVRTGAATMEGAFAILKPWIRHVHVHDGVTRDGKLQMVPIGTGGIDHKRAVELLQSMPYSGYLSGEWINWEPYESHLPRELQTLKSYENP